MGFGSYEFILFFLPIVCIVFYLLRKKELNKLSLYVILLASFLFYASDTPVCLLLLFADIAVNFLLYRLLLQNKGSAHLKRKVILAAGVLLNVLLLGYFKYINFGISICNLLLHTSIDAREVILPLGISFVTFQQIAFLVDTYKGGQTKDGDAARGQEGAYSFTDYALFVSFFPHISSGPIILKDDFFPLLQELKSSAKTDWDRLGSGLYLFFCGLGKKILIADVLAKGVDYTYGNLSSVNATTALLASLLFTLQIYFDFSGYSDMAIGVARMLQLDLPVNFNSPYKAVTITDFWDRWHMTLTRFLTRYLYIPLGGSRKGTVRTYINTLIVFTVSGLWHGASYTFILWGMLHGLFMIFTKHFSRLIGKIPVAVNRVITLLFVNATWILFRAGSFGTLRAYLGALKSGGFGKPDENVLNAITPSYLSCFIQKMPCQWLWILGLIAVVVCISLFAKNTQEQLEEKGLTAGKLVGCLLVGLLSLLSMSGVSTFLYAYF